jgi:hypothetical protein
MSRRGRKRRAAGEDVYWKLILARLGTVEACRRVGIDRKTGYRRRAELGGIPPALVAEDARSYERSRECMSRPSASARSSQ